MKVKIYRSLFGFFLGIGLLVLLSGCGPSLNEIMASYQGRHFNDLIADWGPPDRIMADGRGGQIYIYDRKRTYTSPGRKTTQYKEEHGKKTAETVYYPPETRTYEDTLMFWIDPQGFVYRCARQSR